MKAGVFFHNGLGDGVNGLVLSQTLHLNGWSVDTFQNTLGSMQRWFPHLPVFSYPPLEELPQILDRYDLYCVVYNSSSPFVSQLIAEGKKRFPERCKVFYFYPSKNIVKEPYYQDACVNPSRSVRENLQKFCHELLRLPKKACGNGFVPPAECMHRKYLRRIALHPTSSRPQTNWPKEKYVKLALHLQKMGHQPVFIPGKQDLERWKDVQQQGLELADFSALDGLATFLYESGYLVGNDSGLGHMASALGVPTLTFCRRKALAALWRPSFSPGIVLTPSSWIPNIRGFRLRDREWKRFISVGQAKRAFKRLLKTSD